MTGSGDCSRHNGGPERRLRAGAGPGADGSPAVGGAPDRPIAIPPADAFEEPEWAARSLRTAFAMLSRPEGRAAGRDGYTAWVAGAMEADGALLAVASGAQNGATGKLRVEATWGLARALYPRGSLVSHPASTRSLETGRPQTRAYTAAEPAAGQRLAIAARVPGKPDGWVVWVTLRSSLDRRLLERRLDRCADLARDWFDAADARTWMQVQVDRDGLTGCGSRTWIERILAQEVARCERHTRPLCCGFLDLDAFKDVNTELGHLAGDAVLSEVGRVLRGTVRSYDRVGRWGGDEFLLVFPDTRLAEAERAIEHVRSAIAGVRGGLNASVGLVSWSSGVRSAELIAIADARLREAKNGPAGVTVSSGAGAAGNGPQA